jgi:hypothetical protein
LIETGYARNLGLTNIDGGRCLRLLSIAKFFIIVADAIPMRQRNSLTLLKRPSAFLPVAMSLGALAIVLLFVALHGTAPLGG